MLFSNTPDSVYHPFSSTHMQQKLSLGRVSIKWGAGKQRCSILQDLTITNRWQMVTCKHLHFRSHEYLATCSDTSLSLTDTRHRYDKKYISTLALPAAPGAFLLGHVCAGLHAGDQFLSLCSRSFSLLSPFSSLSPFSAARAHSLIPERHEWSKRTQEGG